MHLWHSLYCPKVLFLILVLRRAKLNGCCAATKLNLCLLSFRSLIIGMFSSGRARNLKKISTRKSISSFSSHVLQTSLSFHHWFHPFLLFLPRSNEDLMLIHGFALLDNIHDTYGALGCLISVEPTPFFLGQQKSLEKLVSHQFTLIATQWHNKPTIIFGFNSSISSFWWWCFPLPGGFTPIFGDQSLQRAPPSCETMRPT